VASADDQPWGVKTPGKPDRERFLKVTRAFLALRDLLAGIVPRAWDGEPTIRRANAYQGSGDQPAGVTVVYREGAYARVMIRRVTAERYMATSLGFPLGMDAVWMAARTA
jgi:hypothetical protein